MTAHPSQRTMPDTPNLDHFRAQIDAIDDQIIALMQQRLEVVKNVKKLKQSEGQRGLFIRSGREGSMMERIVGKFRETDFSPAAAAAIWRQIIGASTCVESPMQISAFYTPQCQHLIWLAREYFGAAIPISTTAKPGQVIADLRDGRANLGLLCAPDEADPWWLLLCQEDSPKIFAHLPGVLTDNLPKGLPTVFAIGMLEPQASGHDESYFALTLDDAVSLSRFQSTLTEAGVNMLATLVHQKPAQRHVLLKVEGFHTLQSPAIMRAQEALSHARIWWLGAHPVPIVL